MSKNVIATALIAALGFAALAPNQASAADGTINITGTVNASTCKINGGSSPVTVNVALPTVSTTALNASGAVAGRTAFALNLSACTAGTKAQAFFEPGSTIMADGNLKNASGTATGVEVQLLNSNFSNINLAGTSSTQASQQITTDSSGNGALNYYAQYFATGAAGAGTVSTSVQFTMLYQ